MKKLNLWYGWDGPEEYPLYWDTPDRNDEGFIPPSDWKNPPIEE